MKNALWIHDYDAVRELLPVTDPNTMIGTMSILKYATYYEYPLDIIHTLLKMGADVNWYSSQQCIPLIAVKSEPIVKLLIDYNANEFADKTITDTPCRYAEAREWFHLLHLFKEEPRIPTNKLICILEKQIISNTEIIDTMKTQLLDYEMYVSFHQLCNF